MTHPILEPLVSQLPDTAVSRKLIEEGKDYQEIISQLTNERQWLRAPESIDDENRTGSWHLTQNGYAEWLKDAEEDDIVEMVGVCHLIRDTVSALKEDEEEDDEDE